MKLHVQNHDKDRATGEWSWVVETHEVETEKDEQGITYLVVDGVRFGLVYSDGSGNACGLGNPAFLPTGRAQQIARRMWVSCRGHGSPSERGVWVTP